MSFVSDLLFLCAGVVPHDVIYFVSGFLSPFKGVDPREILYV